MYIIKLGEDFWLCSCADVVVYWISGSVRMFKTSQEAQKAFWDTRYRWPNLDIKESRIQRIDDKFNVLEEYMIGEI